MRFSCDFCGRGYSVSDLLQGRAFKMKCRACGRDVVVRPPPSAPLAAVGRWASKQPGPGFRPDENPFVVAPITAAAVRALAAPAPGPASPPGGASLRAVATAAPLAPLPASTDDAEDLARALAEVIDEPDPPGAAGWPEPPDRLKGASRPPRLALAAAPEAVRSPPADLLAGAAPSAGPRIALGLAAAMVVAIVVAVLFLPRRQPLAAATGAVEGSAAAAVASPAPPAPRPPAEPAAVAAAPVPPAVAPAPVPGSEARFPPGPPDVALSKPEARLPARSARSEEPRGPAAAAPRAASAPTQAALARPKPEPAPAKEPAAASTAPKAEPPAPAAGEEAEATRSPPPVSAESLRRALAASRAGFDACVAEAVRRDPDLDLADKKVTLTVTVAPTGTVNYPTLDDANLAHSDLGTCLKAAARKLSVASFSGEARRVELPLALSPP